MQSINLKFYSVAILQSGQPKKKRIDFLKEEVRYLSPTNNQNATQTDSEIANAISQALAVAKNKNESDAEIFSLLNKCEALRANNDETLPYAPDTMGKQESQSWQKIRRIDPIQPRSHLARPDGVSATARSCASSKPRTVAQSLVNSVCF